jgi:hypothetical protein
MRRNSTYHRTVVPFLLFLGALLYEALASSSLFLSPLLGVGFYYIIHHIYDEYRYIDFILIFIYALFVEINRGMIPLSFLFFTLIFYKLLFRSFKKYIHCQICLILAYVTIGYLGYFLFNLFLAYLLNITLPIFSTNYFIYILTDIFITLVFL